MRDDRTHFLDMLIAARKIQKFADGLSQEEFSNSELHQSAIIRELLVIGEAARLVSQQGKAEHPEIDWDDISGMRNRLVHEYFRIKLHLVWEAAQSDIPKLIAQLEPLVPPEEKS
jgi:uncharacterized protein with HEPN domain